MSAPRPKRHLNRKNASAEDFTDYEDPPGVELKPSNASTGTIYNFTRHPLDIFGIDVSPPSKIDDITGNITTLASEAGTSYQTAAAIASSTVIGFRSPRDVIPPPPLPVPAIADDTIFSHPLDIFCYRRFAPVEDRRHRRESHFLRVRGGDIVSDCSHRLVDDLWPRQTLPAHYLA